MCAFASAFKYLIQIEIMISTKDIMQRVRVGCSLVPFFKCVVVYFALGGGEGQPPGARAVAAKCAPVLCLLAAVALQSRALPPARARYARRVCCGLALSAAGDALLVWPALLAGGMAAFGGAHVAYLAAFGWRPRRARLGALCLAGAALYVRAVGGAARAPPPALLPPYAALLAAMAWRGAARGGPAAAGALLFLLSDAVLGYALFAGPVPHRQVLVMSTYYLGQLGIAASALPPATPPPATPPPATPPTDERTERRREHVTM